MAESSQVSKAAQKNKKRAEKRSEARIKQIKQNKTASEEIEMKDPVGLLRQQLQEAKDSKDHKLAAQLRQKLWIVQDNAAGVSLAEVESLGGDVTSCTEVNSNKKNTIATAKSTDKTVPSDSPTMGLTFVEKKLRALKKKLQQIESLKEKRAQGETLEKTQIDKIMKEQETLDEISEIQSLLT